MRTACTILAVMILTGAATVAGEDIPQPREEEPSLAKISRQMDRAHQKLQAEHHGSAVQVTQKKVVADLDRLIKALEDARKRNPNAPGDPGDARRKPPGESPSPDAGSPGRRAPANDPANPLNDERLTSGWTQHGRKAELGAVGAAWGDLPGKIRRRTLQVFQAKLPMRYRRLMLIHLMYLAEENSRR